MVDVIRRCTSELSMWNMGNRCRPKEEISKDIRAAAFDIASNKALGLDRLPGLFYQNFWETVGSSMTSACLRCLNEGELLDAVNETLVVLIPKVKKAERMTDFQPISL
ncbi:hypothetical protein Dsin_015654 [Dipteronia sinensis]|uniref:Reverse transcriptase n=1 Tax=Dipteronia sinensis TaxID=43782 RepID=A0AAE0ACC9_9ROSI|nr:hypothetical protein Dsin_015654 [Dipteronia sinensis]